MIALTNPIAAQTNPDTSQALRTSGQFTDPSALESMNAVAEFLDHAKKAVDIAIAANKNDELRRINDVVDYTQQFAALAGALRQDIKEHREPGTNSSHTTEQLAQIGLGLYTRPDKLQDLAALGVISEVAARRIGYLSFGAGDLARGVGTLVGPHQFGDAEAWEHTLDGIVSTAAGIYGFALTRDWDVAQGFASATKLTAEGGRRLSLPLFQFGVDSAMGLNQKFIGLWEQAQRTRIAHGMAPQTIVEFYHGDAEILDKVGQHDVNAANVRLGLPVEQFTRRTFEHYRETCISGYCNRIDLTTPAVAPTPRPLGGIELDRPLTGAELKGVKIDGNHGKIILVGDRDFVAYGLNLRDFAMALWLVYASPHPQDPAFSLDPDDPKNPRGPWMRARYVPDALQGRSIGAEMADGDVLLKELSLGVQLDPHGKLREMTISVPEFESFAHMAMRDSNGGTGKDEWSRFWIVADNVSAHQDADTMMFDARMAVRARRQVPDPSSPTGLRDVPTDPRSLQARWAQVASAQYDALSARFPALARVRELAVTIGIAKALKAEGVRIDLARVAAIINADSISTLNKINSFTVSWQQTSRTPFREGDREGIRTETRTLRLFGGVDLTVVPHMMKDNDEVVVHLGKAVDTAFRMSTPGTSIVHFEYAGAKMEALALPLLPVP